MQDKNVWISLLIVIDDKMAKLGRPKGAKDKKPRKRHRRKSQWIWGPKEAPGHPEQWIRAEKKPKSKWHQAMGKRRAIVHPYSNEHMREIGKLGGEAIAQKYFGKGDKTMKDSDPWKLKELALGVRPIIKRQPGEKVEALNKDDHFIWLVYCDACGHQFFDSFDLVKASDKTFYVGMKCPFCGMKLWIA